MHEFSYFRYQNCSKTEIINKYLKTVEEPMTELVPLQLTLPIATATVHRVVIENKVRWSWCIAGN